MFTVALRHAIKIDTSRERIFRALTDLGEMAAWHVGSVAGTITPGGVLRLKPKAGLAFGWRTEILQQGSSLVQTCVEGPGNSVGKTLRFDLSDTGDGRTLVTLNDSEWSESDPHLAFCNTKWGEVLHRLKSYCEKA